VCVCVCVCVCVRVCVCGVFSKCELCLKVAGLVFLGFLQRNRDAEKRRTDAAGPTTGAPARSFGGRGAAPSSRPAAAPAPAAAAVVGRSRGAPSARSDDGKDDDVEVDAGTDFKDGELSD
jgi:hypothetical protein